MIEENKDSYRMERIQRLLDELKYEVTRGMMENEVPETIGFQFIVPTSRSIHDGVVYCKFETRPKISPYICTDPSLTKFYVVK